MLHLLLHGVALCNTYIDVADDIAKILEKLVLS